jgi:fructose-1,6-bisphosphatase/inositol monophosphatase family enzyme
MRQFEAPFQIGKLGIHAALLRLMPYVRQAGRIAFALQPAIRASTNLTEKGGSRFGSALTDADLIIEDRFGGDLLTLFSDASFCGEERAQDRISRYVPGDQPYIVTLDPVNGTLYYRDGLPLFETIVTICDREWNILGAVAYRPAFEALGLPQLGDLFFASGERGAYSNGVQGEEGLKLDTHDAPKVVYLDEAYSHKEDLVRRAGYTPVFPWRDYAGQPDWPYASCDVLTGECRGILNPNAQLIDSAAFGFIAKRAGGIWEAGTFDPETLRYSYGLSASDPHTAELLRSLL